MVVLSPRKYAKAMNTKQKTIGLNASIVYINPPMAVLPLFLLETVGLDARLGNFHSVLT